MPRASGAGCHLQQEAFQSKTAQLSLAPFASMPPQPEQLPDVPTDPAFQPEDRPPVLSQLEISPPADGKSDLAVAANTQNEVSVLLGEGDGLFGAPKSSALGEGAGGIVAADFNRDGKLDLAVAIGDFNGDGKIDLAVVSRTSLAILLGNGDGTFQPAVTSGPGGYAIAVGDFNRDGKQDLAITNYLSPGAVLILLGNGDGTFQSALSFPLEAYPSSIMTADFNGDGKLDLAVGNSVNTVVPSAVSILLGKGDGTFQPAVSYDSGGVASVLVCSGFQ
jgi:hypothetical protein